MTDSSRRQVIAAAGSLIAASVGRRAFAGAAPQEGTGTTVSTEKDMWRDIVLMNDMGPRYCGNAAHKKYHSFLEDSLGSAGLKVEHINRSALVLWDPIRTSIRTVSTYGAKDIPVASFCRWSAVTGPDGVTAPLKFCGRADWAGSWNQRFLFPNFKPNLTIPADISGKIALIEITTEPCLWKQWYEGHVTMVDPLKAGPMDDVQTTSPTWNASWLPPQFQDDLRKAGAVGLIFAWVNGTDEEAHGQQKAGDEALPSAWVGPTAGKELRAIAERGDRITFVNNAKVTKNVPTQTITATLPGQSDEVIALWTHTDGNNAIEENGGIAMLHLMKHFAAEPKSARKRTIVAVFSEGHFARQYVPTTYWLDARPDLVKKAVATVSIEHLGCQEWVGDPSTNSFTATGKPELMWVNCPTPALRNVMLNASKDTRISRYVVLDNDKNVLPGSGLDAWFHKDLKVPTISWIAVPPYLMAEGRSGHLDKMRPDQFFDDVQTLGRIVRGYDAAPKDVLRPAG